MNYYTLTAQYFK